LKRRKEMNLEDETKTEIVKTHIREDQIIEIISKNKGIPIDEIKKVFDAFENEFPKIVKEFSPTEAGEETIFTTPHFRLAVRCNDEKTHIYSSLNFTTSFNLLIAANDKLVEKGVLNSDYLDTLYKQEVKYDN
jgi:hypothetical protein